MEINLVSNYNVNSIKKDCFNICIGGNYDLNKSILDNKRVNLLLDAEPLEEDFMHYRNSGLNQVLVKMAKKHDIGIGFSLNRINNLDKLRKASLFGKLMQNIRLCNKYKVRYYIVNFNSLKNESDLKSLALTFNIKNINIIQEGIN